MTDTIGTEAEQTEINKAYNLGQRAGRAARNGDWSLVRHLQQDVYRESDQYRKDYRLGYAFSR